MPRFFTLVEARRMLPRVKTLVEHAIESKSQYEDCAQRSEHLIRRIMISGGLNVDRGSAALNRDLQNRSGERLKSSVEEIHEAGVIVKDLDVGLIDFPTLLKGSEVYLCWRLGEDDVRYWHGVHEGFAGRKSIDDEFIANHRGGTEE
jgi:hypothetical protein